MTSDRDWRTRPRWCVCDHRRAAHAVPAGGDVHGPRGVCYGLVALAAPDAAGHRYALCPCPRHRDADDVVVAAGTAPAVPGTAGARVERWWPS